MAKRIAVSTLNASTVDIINVIRANANYEYQSLVPEISTANEIPKVGEVLMGYPALANSFINALVNRIALTKVKSAIFNNDFKDLKKGYLEYGETIEEIFVGIVKAREFSAEKAPSREFKRTLPDVKAAFHAMNWKVQYPITIQDEELRTAFLSVDGVQNLITRIVDAVYTAAEYDEYLLFKYLIIKAITHGKMSPISVGVLDNMTEAAVKFKATTNQLTMMNTKYNEMGVLTTTPKNNQYIFMDSEYDARFDVEVLASAFNMDKADYLAKRKLIDDWTSFDNDRFSIIRDNSDAIELVTEDELKLMANVKAVLVDEEWFQMYDNNTRFTETYVSSGLYWNYNLNIWKTVSSSPFSNAVVFVTDDAVVTLPEIVTATVASKSTSNEATVITLEIQETDPSLVGGQYSFIQTEEAVKAGIAVHKYGAFIFPDGQTEHTPVLVVNGKTYTASEVMTTAVVVGDEVTFA